MMPGLFPELPPTDAELLDRWRQGYAEELLEYPPVQMVAGGPGNPRAAQKARFLAGKDINRALAAAERAGLTIRLELNEK